MLLERLQQISVVATMHADPEDETALAKDSTGESALYLICRAEIRYCNASYIAG